MNFSFLHPVNWSRYSRRYTQQSDGYYHYKRVILLSQFTLFGAILSFLHSLEDLADSVWLLSVMDLILSAGIFSMYILNERGHTKTARILVLTFLNIFFFVYCAITPPELGIYFYYFSWIGLASVIFDAQENNLRTVFIGISILLILLLFATDFRPFGDVAISVYVSSKSFMINLVTSILVLVFFIVQMTSMNDASERRLVQLTGEMGLQNEKLAKVNRELDRFFYSTSHDLRAPLMSVKGLINLMRAEPDLIVSKYLPWCPSGLTGWMNLFGISSITRAT